MKDIRSTQLFYGVQITDKDGDERLVSNGPYGIALMKTRQEAVWFQRQFAYSKTEKPKIVRVTRVISWRVK